MARATEQQRKSARRRASASKAAGHRGGAPPTRALHVALDDDAGSELGSQTDERADGSAIRSDAVSGFTPSPAQVRYLNALKEAVAKGHPHSDTSLCAKLGISRMTLWKWRQRSGFSGWLRARMDQTSDDNWPLILRRHELLAIQGSVRSAEFIAKVRAGTYGKGREVLEPSEDPTQNYTVQLLVHRPDDVASSTLLPLDDPRVQTALSR